MWGSVLLLLASADVGEIALVADAGGQIQSSVLIANRYLERVACAFYEAHEDRYDALFVFSAIPMNAFTRTQAGWSTRRAAMGIGRDIYLDTTSRFCASRLRHAVKMGDIASFSDDPDEIYGGAFGFTLSAVELMGHEMGHQWLAGVTFDRGEGRRRCLLRAFNGSAETPPVADCEGYRNSDFNQHWSYYFSSGSVMYGNTIRDLGDRRFELSNPGTKYSELDQYLMGLRGPEEVSPMFLVDVGAISAESSAFPVSRGQTEIVEGDRIDFTIEDVIRAEGPRVPAREACHWKAAFIIVHEEGSPPPPSEIARVDAHRRRWEEFYAAATDGRGSFDTTLDGSGPGTTGCPAAAAPPPPGEDAGAASAVDGGPVDGGSIDAGSTSSGSMDGGAGDAGEPAAADDGVKVLGLDDCGCTVAGGRSSPVWTVLVLLWAVLRRR